MTITDATIRHMMHAQAGHKGGISRSPAKVEATRRNAMVARAARAARIAEKQNMAAQAAETNGGGQ